MRLNALAVTAGFAVMFASAYPAVNGEAVIIAPEAHGFLHARQGVEIYDLTAGLIKTIIRCCLLTKTASSRVIWRKASTGPPQESPSFGIVAALNQEADAARICKSRSSGLQAGK